MSALDPAVVRAEAERRVARALELVERAQHTLERACEELSPVIGALPDWQRIGKLADRVHDAWRRLAYEKPTGGYGLDEMGRRELGELPPQPPTSTR
jgi:hypothetical protein